MFRVGLEGSRRRGRIAEAARRRPTRFSGLKALLLIMFVCCSGASLYAGDARASALSSVADILVIDQDKGVSTIFLSDDAAGKIWWYTATGQSTFPVNFSQFKELEVVGLAAPSGLAHYKGKLLVCDTARSSLISVDLETKKTEELIRPGVLRAPTRVTVSEDGTAAVTSSRHDGIVFYELAAGKVSPVKGREAANETQRLTYAGRQLVLLNEAGELHVIDPEREEGAQTRQAIKDSLGEHVKDIKDFAVADSSPLSLYVMNDKGVALLSMTNEGRASNTFDALTLPIPARQSPELEPDLIAAAGSDLYVADRAHRRVWKYRHVEAKLEGTMQQSNEALVSLYSLLNAQEILPTLRVVSAERQDSLQEFLLRQNALIGLAPNAAPSAAGAQPPPAPTLLKMSEIVCQINGWTCDYSDRSSSMRWKAVGKNEEVRLPHLPYYTFRWTSPLDLDNRPVTEHLEERIPYKEQRDKITAEYLLRLNNPLRNTLEYWAAAEHFILASPGESNFEAGSLIGVEQNREVRSACADKWSVELRPFPRGGKSSPWSSEMKIDGVADYLPRRLGQPQGAAELAKLGVAGARAVFEEPVEVRAQRPSLTAPTPQCWNEAAGQRRYVVLDALVVSRGVYELLNKDGLPVRLDDGLVSRLGLVGSADAQGRLVVNGPYVVAYRPALWNGPETFAAPDAPAATTPAPQEDASKSVAEKAPAPVVARAPRAKYIIDPREIKPGSRQDVFGRKTGDFTLPIIRWRLGLLTDVNLLANPRSVLREVERNYKGIFILPSPDPQQSAGQSSAAQPGRQQEDKSIVQENRGKLKTTIEYPTPEILETMKEIKNLARLRVGIVEKGGSVDANNADFIWDPETNESAWLSASQGEDYVRPVVSPGRRTGIKRDFKPAEEHGTHVAGIIAANTESWVPGLAASVELMLVDVTRVEELENNIQLAIDQGVSIFNISQAISGNDSNSSLKKGMEERWSDRLFVAAAGNEYLNFNEMAANDRPIKYKLPNLIGVAAADGEGRIMEPFVEDGQTVPGTNYGEEYVQLLAPGRGVYSTAKGSAYVKLSGSSQAAPQVTAAAAMLLAQGVAKAPPILKARLIYTTKWSDNYLDKVWGGLLDFKKAVWEPKRNLFYTSLTDPEEIISIDVVTNKGEVTVTNANGGAYINEPHRRGTSDRIPENTIPFRRILRIQSTGGQRYRVIYFDKLFKLHIIMNAELKGDIEYKAHEVWDRGSRTFKPVNLPARHKLPVSSIVDYVAEANKVPEKLQF